MVSLVSQCQEKLGKLLKKQDALILKVVGPKESE